MHLALQSLLLLAPQTAAEPPVFAPPVRARAGEAFLGVDRLFPSPVFHDLDGDGRLDVVVGDLLGQLTVAWRAAEGLVFGAEAPVLGADGARVDLDNW